MKRTLGTQLRHLIELLDGAVANAYLELGLPYRPRYTPVMRALMTGEPATIGQVAQAAGITQPAATQTINLMARDGLVTVATGEHDARQKLVRLSPLGQQLVPELVACWQATAAAAASLDSDLGLSLSDTLERAIAALGTASFAQRIASARGQQGRRA
jgi:DNA-binding MarR family transcriptional regulator